MSSIMQQQQQHYMNYENAPKMGNAVNMKGLQLRNEYLARDQINAYNYEHWQTDGPSMTYNTADKNRVPIHKDTMPQASRTNHKDYRGTPLYSHSANDRQHFYRDEYYQSMDIKSDPYNVIREMKKTVVEMKDDRGLKENTAIYDRLVKR